MLSQSERQRRFGYLAMGLVPLVGSFFYAQGLRLPFFRGCPLLHYTGIPCPAWGLTRSFMAIARGDWSQAIAYHLFGPLFFASFLVLVTHCLLELLLDRRVQAFYRPLVQNPKLQILGFFMLLGYHSTRLYALGRSGELYASLLNSPLGQWLY